MAIPGGDETYASVPCRLEEHLFCVDGAGRMCAVNGRASMRIDAANLGQLESKRYTRNLGLVLHGKHNFCVIREVILGGAVSYLVSITSSVYSVRREKVEPRTVPTR